MNFQEQVVFESKLIDNSFVTAIKWDSSIQTFIN